jgi:hypothetical protein
MDVRGTNRNKLEPTNLAVQTMCETSAKIDFKRGAVEVF